VGRILAGLIRFSVDHRWQCALLTNLLTRLELCKLEPVFILSGSPVFHSVALIYGAGAQLSISPRSRS
jgi:hypothetical protein